MKNKIAEIKSGNGSNPTPLQKAEAILSLLRENIPAEKKVSKLGNLAENDRNEGWNSYRQSLLQALLGNVLNADMNNFVLVLIVNVG